LSNKEAEGRLFLESNAHKRAIEREDLALDARVRMGAHQGRRREVRREREEERERMRGRTENEREKKVLL